MSPKNKAPKSYGAAAEELQAIVEELQEGEIDVDQLAERVKRAKFLIDFCQQKLRNTETEVKSLFSDQQE